MPKTMDYKGLFLALKSTVFAKIIHYNRLSLKLKITFIIHYNRLSSILFLKLNWITFAEIFAKFAIFVIKCLFVSASPPQVFLTPPNSTGEGRGGGGAGYMDSQSSTPQPQILPLNKSLPPPPRLAIGGGEWIMIGYNGFCLYWHKNY